jgi:DNA-binding NarL/FixJ family response regulator
MEVLLIEDDEAFRLGIEAFLLPLPCIAELTPRERDVLEAMADGLTNQQIASSLGIGVGTVRVYIHTIFQKLQVTNRTQAVLLLLGRR